MKISQRIALGYVLMVAVAAWFVQNPMMDAAKPAVRQAMEDTLIDTANVLARLAVADLQSGRIGSGEFAQALNRIDQVPLQAHVWNMRKDHIDYRVHVTDAKGLVVFDSAGQDVGKDFSRWNDVLRTLRGEYGARSTRTDAADEKSSVMHIAAPIVAGKQLLGVLTVAKPNRVVEPYIERAKDKILRAGLLLLGVALVIGIAFALWITVSLGQLLRYAERVSNDEKAQPPDLGTSELATLSRALAGMREKLEGKHYVERYVHTLTHEMKSPLTAIAGSAELLGEDLPPDQRGRFAAHVLQQAQRLQQLVDRMLGLASVESRQRLQTVQTVDIAAVVAEQLASHAVVLTQRHLTATYAGAPMAMVQGDPFLLAQALGNLLDNAIDFSADGSSIEVAIAHQHDLLTITVADRGTGVPDYAIDRVFERFYSLPRPATGHKSTGLGLPFVREVAQLHRGAVRLEPREGGGTLATLSVPAGVGAN